MFVLLHFNPSNSARDQIAVYQITQSHTAKPKNHINIAKKV